MPAVFSRPLRRARHILTVEWCAELERLQARCRHPHVRPTRRQSHLWICDDCNRALYGALEASLLRDTAPLHLLASLNDHLDHLERTAA